MQTPISTCNVVFCQTSFYLLLNFLCRRNKRRLPPLLRNCWNKLNASFKKRLLQIGITPDQYIVLRWLYEKHGGEINQSRLAKLMFTDANNISSLTSRMEKAGLLKRTNSKSDRRQKFLQITSLGKANFQACQPIAERLENEVLSGLNDKDSKRLQVSFVSLEGFLNKSIERLIFHCPIFRQTHCP